MQAVALQAPVSDREGAMNQPDYKKNIQYALELRHSGKDMEFMPRNTFWAPISAKRLLDLQERGGADDFFSSDVSDEELTERLGHVGKLRNLELLVAFSGSDEYVPTNVNAEALTDRLVAAMNTHGFVAKALYMQTANHNLSMGKGDMEQFVDQVSQLLHNAVH